MPPRKSAPTLSRLFLSVIAVVVLLPAALLPGAARAEITIDITKGVVEPLPVAITDFAGDTSTTASVGRQVAQVIGANLDRSGLFRPLDERAFIQRHVAMNTFPRFGDWRIINAQILVHGRVVTDAGGKWAIEFRAWDVFSEQQLVARRFLLKDNDWRRTAHIISDEIYSRITGEAGYFDTRIVYVAEQPANARGVGLNPQNPFGKRLAIMDQDGANHKFLTDGSTLVLTPRFSPTSQEITYMSYFRNLPRVYIFNLETGTQEVLGDFPGMTFAPRFSHDGKKVIFSMAKDGNSEIFTMDPRTRDVKQLTFHSAIDTSPSYAPGGERIVFNSDRSGKQQIYIMSAEGRDVRRITFGQGRYGTPVWSPRGDLIAFTRIHKGRFFIGVIKPDGTGERLLAEDFKIEGPTWSPNGRVLMFYRKTKTNRDGSGGKARLFSIDLTGRNEREIPTPLGGSDPAWSPDLPESRE